MREVWSNNVSLLTWLWVSNQWNVNKQRWNVNQQQLRIPWVDYLVEYIVWCILAATNKGLYIIFLSKLSLLVAEYMSCSPCSRHRNCEFSWGGDLRGPGGIPMKGDDCHLNHQRYYTVRASFEEMPFGFAWQDLLTKDWTTHWTALMSRCFSLIDG